MTDKKTPERPGAEELRQNLARIAKLRIALRTLVGVVITIALLDVFSLTQVSRESPEYYVCVFTLILAALLLAGALAVNAALSRAVARDKAELDARKREDRADPWKL